MIQQRKRRRFADRHGQRNARDHSGEGHGSPGQDRQCGISGQRRVCICSAPWLCGGRGPDDDCADAGNEAAGRRARRSNCAAGNKERGLRKEEENYGIQRDFEACPCAAR